MRKVFLLSILTLWIPGDTRAGWGLGGCATSATVVAPVPSSVPFTGWSQRKGVWYFYDRGKQVSGYNPDTKAYRKYDWLTETWGEPETPPWETTTCRCGGICTCDPCKCVDCKCAKPAEKADKPLFGVEVDKLHKDGITRHYFKGQQVPRQEAIAALKLADDSTKPYVTFIGQNREQLAQAFATTAEATKCRVNSYAADSWYAKPGFVTNGTPTVYVQNAKGEVLYRGDHPSLETVVSEVRKAQPDYDPAKDPNGVSDPFAGLVKLFKDLPPIAYLAIGLGLAFLIFKKG